MVASARVNVFYDKRPSKGFVFMIIYFEMYGNMLSVNSSKYYTVFKYDIPVGNWIFLLLLPYKIHCTRRDQHDIKSQVVYMRVCMTLAKPSGRFYIINVRQMFLFSLLLLLLLHITVYVFLCVRAAFHLRCPPGYILYRRNYTFIHYNNTLSGSFILLFLLL